MARRVAAVVPIATKRQMVRSATDRRRPSDHVAQDRPLYVEMRGERSKTNTTCSVQRALGTVEYAPSYRVILQRHSMLASGEGPPGDGRSDSAATLELPDKVSRKLPVSAFKAMDQAAKEALSRIYETPLPDGIPLRVEVVPQMCTDGKSETAYGARVSVRSGKGILQGCAARF